uniref:Uncharacterized protein n=1 Tax=Panagrolaimus sp. JU765 TaxID=591449 RepID=A0AC34RSW6_9BILA
MHRAPKFEFSPGYKYVTPFISVDAAARTLNFLTINLKGEVDIKIESWRFNFNGLGKALKYEKIDLRNFYLPKFRGEKIMTRKPLNKPFMEDDYITLEFLRNFNPKDEANKGSFCQFEPMMTSYNLAHTISLTYEKMTIWATPGKYAKRRGCHDSKSE